MASSRQDEKTTEKTTQTVAENVRRTGEQATEQARRFGSATMNAGEQAAEAGADVFRHNAEVVQDAWRSGMELATTVTRRSADQFARVFGLSGDEGQEATQQAARNVEAMFRSTGAFAQGMNGIAREWLNFIRERTESNLNRVGELWRCRTPQDLVAVHSELIRDNVEGVLETGRRVAGVSLKLADDASRKMTETTDRIKRAA
jgi:hypothetical protein